MSEFKKSDADVVEEEVLHGIWVVPFDLDCEPDLLLAKTLGN